MTRYAQGSVIRIAFFSLLLCLFFSSQVYFAHAQTSSGLTIKPAVVEDKATPGGSYTYSLSVTNEGAAQQTYYLEAQDIKGLDDRGQPVFAKEGEQTGYELSSWITFDQNTVTLESKQTKTITFSVQVPGRASPGAHFASVLFADHPGRLQASGSAVGFSVGAIVSLQIAGNIVEDAMLQEFSTSKLVYGAPHVDFNAKVQNNGNVLVRPTGLISITNLFGKEIAQVQVNQTVGAVFPNSSRTFTTTWDYPGFLFGRYQAVASLAYGDEGRKTISNTTSFWVLPLMTIAIVLGALILLIGIFSLFIKLYIRGKLREMGVDTRSDAALYRRKYQQTSSRLMTVTFGVVLLCVIFLIALFILFA